MNFTRRRPILAMGLMTASLLPAGSPADELTINPVHQWPGGSSNVSLKGDWAAVTIDGGLGMVSVTDPAHPRIVSRLPKARLGRIDYQPPYVYGVAGNEFVIFDVHDPAHPTIAGTWAAPAPSTRLTGFEVDGGVAYVCTPSPDGSLSILDIQTSATPTLLSRTPLDDAADAATSGSLCVVPGGTSLVVLDVSDPSAPAALSTTSLPAGPPGEADYQAVRVLLQGSRAHVVLSGPSSFFPGRWNTFLGTVDLADPSSPEAFPPVPDTMFGNPPTALELYDGLIYLLVGGVHVYDAQTTSAAQRLGTIPHPGSPSDISFDGTRASLAGAELELHDFTNPIAPVLLGSLGAITSPYAVHTEGSTAWVAANDGTGTTLIAIDVAGMGTDQPLGSYQSGFLNDFTLRNGIGYAVNTAGTPGVYYGELRILDLADPAHTSLLSTYRTYGTGQGVDLNGNIAVIADGWAGVHLADVSDALHPAFASYLPVREGNILHVTIQDDVVFAGGAWDISDPYHPQTLTLGNWPDRVTAMQPTPGGLMALGITTADHRCKLQLADYTNPAVPLPVGAPIDLGAAPYSNSPGVTNIGFHDSYLYATLLEYGTGGSTGSVHVLDAFDPGNIRYITKAADSQGPIAFAGDILVTADGSVRSYQISQSVIPAVGALLGTESPSAPADSNRDWVLDVGDILRETPP